MLKLIDILYDVESGMLSPQVKKRHSAFRDAFCIQLFMPIILMNLSYDSEFGVWGRCVGLVKPIWGIADHSLKHCNKWYKVVWKSKKGKEN